MSRLAWPYCVPLCEDELLSSFLIRNAHVHGATPYSFLSFHLPGRHCWDRDTDRTSENSWLGEISALSGVSVERLERGTLQPFRRVLGSTLPNGNTPWLLSVSVFHRTRRRYGLQFCPACFAEGRRWFRRIWRLGFVLVCPEHGVPLLDACPVCASPVIPHRGPWLDVARCHQCGVSRTGDGGVMVPPDDALEWQRSLLDSLSGTSRNVGPFPQSEAFASVRCLVSVLTARPVHEAIREAFRLPPVALPDTRLQLEHARVMERRWLLETMAAWLADWPATFRAGAAAARLTQRTFYRFKLPATLHMEVERLPPGNERDSRYVPKVFDAELLRLRRTDKKAYRALRARRLQALVGL